MHTHVEETSKHLRERQQRPHKHWDYTRMNIIYQGKTRLFLRLNVAA
jgi:hypothetical protein